MCNCANCELNRYALEKARKGRALAAKTFGGERLKQSLADWDAYIRKLEACSRMLEATARSWEQMEL